MRGGAGGVGDDQHVGGERAGLAVERRQRLAGRGPPDDDGGVGEPGVVERVHRLARARAARSW